MLSKHSTTKRRFVTKPNAASDGAEMRKLLRRWKSNQRGTATLEMGLTLPLLIAAMFPPMEIARYSYANRILESSVNEGAKFAALTLASPNATVTEDDVRDLIIEQAGKYAPQRSAIIITYSPAKEPGARVTVAATAEFNETIEIFGDYSHSVDGTRTLF